MPYQYKREPLNDDEVNRITNACDTFREKFVGWTLLDTGLILSEFGDLETCLPVCPKAHILSQLYQKRNLHQSPPNAPRPRQTNNY